MLSPRSLSQQSTHSHQAAPPPPTVATATVSTAATASTAAAAFTTVAPASNDTLIRQTLPDRNVTASTLEDAYVRFIFYCNPGLPLSVDTQSLRESFKNPPRSGGKVFDPFTIYNLVRRFYQKEIKTWTELTTTLGVEPPDLSKDESAQKVAQYGVRLKVSALLSIFAPPTMRYPVDRA